MKSSSLLLLLHLSLASADLFEAQKNAIHEMCSSLSTWCGTTTYVQGDNDQDLCTVLKRFMTCKGKDVDQFDLDATNMPDGQKITGTIPTEIGIFTALRIFHARGNSISGTLPTELGLTAIYDFNMDTNSLTGTIPTELGSLNLIGLELSSNSLTGSIPAQLFTSQLQNLGLRENELSGTIPREVRNAANLRFLRFSKNQLSGTIPLDLYELTNLFELQANTNQFTGTISSKISQLTSLNVLTLHENSFSGTIPREMGLMKPGESVPFGTYFIIGSPLLTGTIPTEFGFLTGLTQLVIFDSPGITGTIPVELAQMTSLTTLWLMNNSLFGGIPSEFNQMTSLSFLRLNGNLLGGTIPDLSSVFGPGRGAFQELVINNNYFDGSFPSNLGPQVSFDCRGTHLGPTEICTNPRPLCIQPQNNVARNLAINGCLESPSRVLRATVSFAPALDEDCFSEYILYLGTNDGPSGSILSRVGKSPRKEDGTLTLPLTDPVPLGTTSTHLYIVSTYTVPLDVSQSLSTSSKVSLADVPLCVTTRSATPSPLPAIFPSTSPTRSPVSSGTQRASVSPSPSSVPIVVENEDSGDKKSNTGTTIAIAVIIVSAAFIVVLIAFYRYRSQSSSSNKKPRVRVERSRMDDDEGESMRAAYVL